MQIKVTNREKIIQLVQGDNLIEVENLDELIKDLKLKRVELSPKEKYHTHLQRKLFLDIKLIDDDMHHTVPKLLNLCKEAFYRRVRGETEMKAGELAILKNYYNLNLNDYV